MLRDKIVIIGGGGHAKVLISILKKLNKYVVAGYTDIKNNGRILDVEYLGNDNVFSELFFKKNIRNAVIGIGQIKNIEYRKTLIEKYIKIGFNFPVIVSPNSIINEDVKLGKGTVVMDGAIINSGSEIGSFCIINTKSSIDHDCKIGNFVHIAPGVTISGGVKIGNNTLIGIGASIIQYKEIGKNIVIGAGAVVIYDLIKPGTYIGIPARKIK